MKNLKRLSAALVATSYLLLFTFYSSAQNIGISPTGVKPDASALLDLSSEDKGFLITRADTLDIMSPAFGLMTLSPEDSCLYMNNGKTSGKTWISIGGVGINCSTPEDANSLIPNVTSNTGKIWMDRNLGATQVAISPTDAAAYGDLYQWGRFSDGHEKLTSTASTTLSITDTPGHSSFIISSSDWRNPENDNLWQGVAGTNNPCPTGYRLPTESELETERLSWSPNNATGAFDSPLKITMPGYRKHTDASLLYDGTRGVYWSSTIANDLAKGLFVRSNDNYLGSNRRARACSIRCIKD